MFVAAVDDRRFASRRQVAGSFTLPAPVGGLNAKDAYTDMDKQDAVILTNVFPEANYLTVRNGYVESSTGMTDPVRSLMTRNGLTGADEQFAGAGSDIWDVNADPAVSVVSGLTNVDFQWTNIKTAGGLYLAYVNGADPYGVYDGATWTEPVVTGATSSTFANVALFKERLWFSVKDSLDTYYLGLQSIAGAASVFPLGAIFHRGGYVIGIGTFSNDAGEGPDDYLCFITNNGEVAVYQGTDPDSANTFALVGRFNVGMPIGRRCTVRASGDLGIITQDGIVSMQAALRFSRESVQKATITGKIQTLFSQYAQQYKNNFGWAPCIFPKARYLIVNIPQIEDETQVQLVMNTITGAWCQFTMMNAGCWGVANDQLYFGGNDGNLYQADVGFLDDLTGNIPWEVQTAWQMVAGATGKFFTMVRPTMQVGTGVAFGIKVNIDFESSAPDISLAALADTTSTMQWPWLWPGTWGGMTILDNRWQSTGAIGTWVSVHMVGTVRDGACQINDFEIVAEKGGIL
jgi:hypothetical protein